MKVIWLTGRCRLILNQRSKKKGGIEEAKSWLLSLKRKDSRPIKGLKILFYLQLQQKKIKIDKYTNP